MLSKTFPSSALIVTHYFTTGPGVELRDFLQSKIQTLYYLSHPFPFAKGNKKSMLTQFDNGKQVAIKTFPWLPKNQLLLFIKDVWSTIVFGFSIKNKVDICIACDNLNAIAALFLRRFGKVDKVIYYNIDYTPNRFSNKFMNNIYHMIDRFCCYQTDVNWIGTKRTMIARKKNGVNIKRVSPTVIVPDGNHSRSIKKFDIKHISKQKISFVGHILKKQGVDLLVDSFPELQKKFSKLTYVIIGDGEYLPALRKKIKQMGLVSKIQLKGYVKNHDEIENIIAQSAIAAAPYVSDEDSVTNYSEAGKPKLYLGCGVPVILTNVPSVARLIKKRRAGVVIDYTVKSFINGVCSLLKNDKTYEMYKNNATMLGLEFDWGSIFTKAIRNSQKYL